MLAVLKSDVNFKRRCDGIPPVPAPGTPRATRKGKWVIKAYQCWPRKRTSCWLYWPYLTLYGEAIFSSLIYVRVAFYFLKRSARAFLQIDIRSLCHNRRHVVYRCSFKVNNFLSKNYAIRYVRGNEQDILIK